jgi:sec-independent protein translocase protein TatA
MLLQVMGLPGGVELLIILVMMIVMFGVPLVVVLGGGYAWFRSQEKSRERVERLENEVSQLRDELREADVTDPDSEGDAGDRRDDA